MPYLNKTDVLNYYLEKRDAGEISGNLASPTAAQIRDECLSLLLTKTSLNDMSGLRSFFGPKNNIDDYARAIRAFDIDKFKPLVRFMKQRTNASHAKNIELLAWLISYPHQSYDRGSDSVEKQQGRPEKSPPEAKKILSENDMSVISGSSNVLNPSANKFGDLLIRTGNKLLKKRTVAFAVVLALALILFAPKIIQTLRGSLVPTALDCMYWNGNKYVETDCRQPAGPDAIAVDPIKLNNFRQITRPDTITAKHINKVWYLKTNNLIELFTAEGYHPKESGRRLRPLSKHMYNKYVVTKKVKID